MAAEELGPSVQQNEEEHEHRGAEETAAAGGGGGGATAAKKEPDEHGGEKKRPAPAAAAAAWKPGKRRRIIQEHLKLTEDAIAKLQDESEREQMAAVAASLRRQEATADQDELAGRPPRRMALRPETVAHYRRVAAPGHLEATRGELGRAVRALPAELGRLLPGFAAQAAALAETFAEESGENAGGESRQQQHAAGMLEEYDAKGYIDHYQMEDFDLPPNYYQLLAKRHEQR